MVNYVPMPVYQAGIGKPRKTLINKSKVPSFDKACNPYYYCWHNCDYCYAKDFTKFKGDIKEDEEWKVPLLVPNALELVEKEIPKLKPDTRIHLSFMTDPYMYGYPEIATTSTAIIRKINEAGFACSVLTKGILPIELANLSRDNWYGITVVTLDEYWRLRHEPGASRIMDRIAALKALKGQGCNVYISMEPVFPPWLDGLDFDMLTSLLRELQFVDHIIFGRANHIAEVNSGGDYRSYYNEAARIVSEFCEVHGISYQIKPGTVTE